MPTFNVRFPNQERQELSGRLELPPGPPRAFALFAHCFTCTKNLTATVAISRALTAAGYGVLRFDFTGLGESEGAFADTNFSSNVTDLLAAATFLKENYLAPSLLIGHSLGGAAVLYAAAALPDIRAVATIGAPSDPAHVARLLKDHAELIEKQGKATVNLEGRNFTIRKQFLDDLNQRALPDLVQGLRVALLFLHAPQDQVVSIENARRLFTAAHHPKSFVSLDGADHLLSRKEDALYAGNLIGAWAARYLEEKPIETAEETKNVVARLDGKDQFTTRMQLGSHHILSDEPIAFGGNDMGPSPYELLAGALAACTAMTIQLYARNKQWQVANVTVAVQHSRQHALDCEACEVAGARIDTFEREIVLTGDLDEAQKKRLLQIADKCPVHKTLHSMVQVSTKLKN